MAAKRFLNVLYENLPVRIDTKEMEDISQVQEKVLLAFKEITVGYARVQLWNKNATPHIQLDDFDDIKALPEEYYLKSKNPGALFLTVQVLPSPPASRQPTSTDIFQGSPLFTAEEDVRRKKQRTEIIDLTSQLQSFANATLVKSTPLQSSAENQLDFESIQSTQLQSSAENQWDVESIQSTELQSSAENQWDVESIQSTQPEDTKLEVKCIQSPENAFLPYPQDKIKKLYVRKCYEDVFDLLLEEIGRGRMESFAISGTPGIGKSLFFVYILYRLMNDFTKKELSLKPDRILYQMKSVYTCFDLKEKIVTQISHLDAALAVREQGTFYVVDGQSTPLTSSCITLFISSPRSPEYKDFVKQKMAKEWYFPVWTLGELLACQCQCYPDLPIDILKERYRVYGGVARFVFHIDYSIPVPKKMESALADINAVRGVKYVGATTDIFPESHTLLQIQVGVDQHGNAYQFIDLDVASKYVGEQLWIRHAAEMVNNLLQMLGGSPNEISRHLFEIYGHNVFSKGGQTLKCKCLEDETVSEIKLDALNSSRITFGKDTIPTVEALSRSYFEPTDEDNFPAVDSLSPQGMFQFTVASKHPIRGVKILQMLCKLYGNESKLYFVVPPDRFENFKKQSFKAKNGTNEVKSIPGLKQFVLELPVEVARLKRLNK